jgi:hypothetical protein
MFAPALFVAARERVRAMRCIARNPVGAVSLVRSRSLPPPYRGVHVQRKKAIELQRAWGDKPCVHPAFSREYDLGERTGSYRCTQCGASFTFHEKSAIATARNAKSHRPDE